MKALLLFLLIGLIVGAAAARASLPFHEFVDPNPNPGNQFGHKVVALTTGNVVITAPFDDAGGTDAGAVYLFNGATGELISTLRGSAANDRVGGSGVTPLSNGNYVVRSSGWDNGAIADAGAVTWGNGNTGISGVVGITNSLVGSTAGDQVGSVTPLSNGNYVVQTRSWDNGSATNAGAVTWGSGSTGISGVVSSANSLVGSTNWDEVGGTSYIDSFGNFTVANGSGVVPLSNGNYVVRSQSWNNGTVKDAGAVTWGNGSTGTSGEVSSSNSLVGTSTDDLVGYVDLSGRAPGVVALSNGNYVVVSQRWNNGAVSRAGAVTWGDGDVGITGEVSSSNSLVGTSFGDEVGYTGFFNDAPGVVALSNGNYVVCSPSWNNGATNDAGAVTWCDGSTGVSGGVSVANSLVGNTSSDGVGSGGVVVLSNGNYVAISPDWDNGAATNAGAVTWGNGTTVISGEVSSANSLVGGTASASVGDVDLRLPVRSVVALSNGNYVVSSPKWDDGAATDVGAVTWGDGAAGTTGLVSGANSLVGSTINDQVGEYSVVALSNGNYVVRSPNWDNGAATDAGAATWVDGSAGTAAVVSVANSLVGSNVSDRVGWVVALNNGNYLASSPNWDNSLATDVGAVTWGNGNTGISGVVSIANSLVGSTAGDQVGEVTPLSNGNYVVGSRYWDNGAVTDAGAVTWGNGTTGISGEVSSANSLVGSAVGEEIGSIRLTVLSNGNYLVSILFWDNGGSSDAGAVTWGNGSKGISGEVSSINSLVGLSANATLNLPIVDNVNLTFFCRFLNEGNGKVRVGSQLGNSEMMVTCNGGDIPNGSITPSAANHTDFGSVAMLNTQVRRTLAITNTGLVPLSLSGSPLVSLSGPHARDFVVTRLPQASVAEAGQTEFEIAFDPSLPGLRSAIVSIASDDPAGNPYTFSVSGFGGLSTPLAQSITFAPPTTLYLGQSPVTLSAYASSGLPVTLSILSGPATLAGEVLNFTAAGTVKVTASQSGAGSYAPAAPVTRTITVRADPAALTLLGLAQTYNGEPCPISTIGGTGPVTITYRIAGVFGSTPPTDAGSYSVKAVAGSVVKSGTLVIAKAPLLVTPDDKRKFAGQANPLLTFTYGPFQGTDTAAAVTAAPILSTTATPASRGGLYPITAKGGTATNYRFVLRMGTLVVESFAGAYEALLVDSSAVPIGKLSVNVPATGNTFTGTLHCGTEVSALSLKGTVTTNPGAELATGTATVNKNTVPYVVNFTLSPHGAVLASVTRSSLALGNAADGRKLLVNRNVAWQGNHTVVMEPALPAGAMVPAGAGWATAAVTASGDMRLVGRLGDATAFTASIKPDVDDDPSYLLFAQPYRAVRAGAYAAGKVTLTPHPSLPLRRFVEESAITWVKVGLPADASYRSGFGPVTTALMLDPWVKPTAALPLPAKLGLTGGAIALVHGPSGGASLPTTLPTSATMSNTNVVTPAANTATWKITALSAATGTFSGSFEPVDGTQSRPVPFTGILRQPSSSDDVLIGNGHYLHPPSAGALSSENTAGEVMWQRTPATP